MVFLFFLKGQVVVFFILEGISCVDLGKDFIFFGFG